MYFIPFYIFLSVFRAHWGYYLLTCMVAVAFIAAISIVPCGFLSVNGINIYLFIIVVFRMLPGGQKGLFCRG